MDQKPKPSGSEIQTAPHKAEKSASTEKTRFAAPFEVLGPCRSRILMGTAMFAVLIGLIFLMAG